MSPGLWRILQISQKQPQSTLLSSPIYFTETKAFLQKEGHRQRGRQPTVEECRWGGDTGKPVSALSTGPLALGLCFTNLPTNKALEGSLQQKLYVLFPSSIERTSQKITSRLSQECTLERLSPVTGQLFSDFIKCLEKEAMCLELVGPL